MGKGLICDDCGKQDETVDDTICPFAYEIHEEQIPCQLCPDCHHERCMDV